MIRNRFKDMELPALGMGTMRLPVTGGDDSRIDMEAARRLIARCMERGVNYFDTAYGYHGGNAEPAMGELLSDYGRDTYFLATKFPGYDLSLMPRVKEIFEEQLRRCRTDHFDFYLLHNVCEMNIGGYLDPRHGIPAYLAEQRRAGRIRHLGFSAHGGMACLRRFLDACGADMEFALIELNYFDWRFQNARDKVELLRSRGLPVWAMEPLRGGRLSRLDAPSAARLRATRRGEDAVAWAFRFLQGVPGVTVVLSGMSSVEQLEWNADIFSEWKPLDEGERRLLLSVADGMIARAGVPCTACHYCASRCPQGLDIPALLHLCNEAALGGPGEWIAPMGLAALPGGKRPGDCLACHRCEEVCPQQIRVADELRRLAGWMEGA